MSSDPSTAVLVRLDVAADGARPTAAVLPGDLAELAAALARAEALIAAGSAEGPDGCAAVERIADIAFVLHERDVERSLCDALDAAVREISAAGALRRTSLQRAHEAAGLLRESSRRVDDMIAAAVQQQAPPPAAAAAPPSSGGVEPALQSQGTEAAADEPPATAGLFDVALPEDDAFALAVAALAESLPRSAGAAEADLQHEVTETAAPPAAQVGPIDAFECIEGPDKVPAHEERSLAPQQAQPSPPAESPPSIDPDEDPDDLFEPIADVRSPAATVVPPATAAPSSHGAAVPASVMSEALPSAAVAPAVPDVKPEEPAAASASRLAAAAPAQRAPRPAANDPLASIRALSEEELIALFS